MDLFRGPLGNLALQPLEFRRFMPYIELKTNHKSHFHVVANEARYWSFLYQPNVRTPPLLALLVIGWSNILTSGMNLLGVLVWGSKWRISFSSPAVIAQNRG
jgi:hypothetical protein